VELKMEMTKIQIPSSRTMIMTLKIMIVTTAVMVARVAGSQDANRLPTKKLMVAISERKTVNLNLLKAQHLLRKTLSSSWPVKM
jgi:hypothetical protein